MSRFICIHGHFYQPPRENPWLEEVELQDSAYPYHDWNERITAECYAPNTASRTLDAERKIIDIVNNYSKISFNFGPSLLSWLERHKPDVHQAVIEADKKSQGLFSGHGSALAQVYNHLIMPLANSQDKRTQVIWGIRDFQYRFHREPEGMWLPETAVDLQTLEFLAEHQIKFTILAPSQAHKVRKINDGKWHDVSGGKIDPKAPYICRLPSGKSIALFFYDGPISHELAFGRLLKSGEGFAKKLISAFPKDNQESQLVHIATDGETYGHHHVFGDMALAYCLYYIESNNLAKVTNYAEYLTGHPPVREVEIFEDSSWSCVHGIERWRSDCGCNSGMHQEWSQQWRAALRGAMDWLRDNLIQIYQEQSKDLFKDCWLARDNYIDVILNRSKENIEGFFRTQAAKPLSDLEKNKAIRLLEMQRYAMLMYTSCGWFFDEISGPETLQVISYAARAIQLARSVSGVALEEAFKGLLERAKSNIPDFQDGLGVYEKLIQPAVLDLLRVGVHYAVSSLFTEYKKKSSLYTYSVKQLSYDKTDLGKQRVALGRILLSSNITREEEDISFAALYLGDHNVVCGARNYQGEELFSTLQQEIKEKFSKGEASEIIRIIDANFSSHSFSLWHIFRDEQRKIIRQIVKDAQLETTVTFRQIYEHQSAVMQFLVGLGIPLPRYFSSIVGFVLDSDIHETLESEGFQVDKLKKLSEELKRWSPKIDKAALGFIAARKVNEIFEEFSKKPKEIKFMEQIVEFMGVLESFSLSSNLWKAQNIYFSLGKQLLCSMRESAQNGKEEALRWLELFSKLGESLKVKVS